MAYAATDALPLTMQNARAPILGKGRSEMSAMLPIVWWLALYIQLSVDTNKLTLSKSAFTNFIASVAVGTDPQLREWEVGGSTAIFIFSS